MKNHPASPVFQLLVRILRFCHMALPRLTSNTVDPSDDTEGSDVEGGHELFSGNWFDDSDASDAEDSTAMEVVSAAAAATASTVSRHRGRNNTRCQHRLLPRRSSSSSSNRLWLRNSSRRELHSISSSRSSS